MGPSGAGKSTLLSILGMLDHDWAGEYRLLEHDVHRMKPRERIELNKKYVGFVFQQYHLLDNLTVAENLDIPLSYRNVKARSGRPSSPTRSTASRSSARRTSSRTSSPAASSSSSAWRARSSRSRSSCWPTSRPATSTTDQGREIMRLFKSLNAEGMTIIQVTHSEENASYGDRIVRLRDGWIVND